MRTHPVFPSATLPVKHWLVFATVAATLVSCFENPTRARLATEIVSTSSTSIVLHTAVSSDVESDIVQKGMCMSTQPTPRFESGAIHVLSGSGDFDSEIFMSPGTTYYFRAYAINGAGLSYGNTISASLVGISLGFVYDITGISAMAESTVTTDKPLIARGLCWSTSPEPTVDDANTNDGQAGGYRLSPITGLAPGTTYYLRAYATSTTGTVYSESTSFTTVGYASVSTKTLGNVNSFIPTCGGDIIETGGSVVTAAGVCWSTHPSPTLADASTEDYVHYTSFNSTLSGLAPNTTYYVRAYATNGVGTAYGNERTFTTAATAAVDNDGNVYSSVAIGTQVWLVENLKSTTYANGDAIENITGAIPWQSATTGAWSYYENTSAYNHPYGKLYNWYAVSDTRNVCPDGWHVPTDAEWITLIDFLGGAPEAGGKLKEAGNVHWMDPNTGGTNSSGFTALPGASIPGYPGYVHAVGSNGLYWSSTAMDGENAYSYALGAHNAGVTQMIHRKQYGFSVRCLKD